MTEAQICWEGNFIRMLRSGEWEYVERLRSHGAVVIIAVTDSREIILVEQFRPPMRSTVIELPAGLVGDEIGHENESLGAAARRELLEETGYEARTVVQLTSGPTTAGLSNETVTLMLARGLTKKNEGGGAGSEKIRVHCVPVESAQEWLAEKGRQGIPVDPKVYAALYFALG